MARWVGLQKSYVINGVGHEKILCLLTRWVGGSENGLKYAYVIFEWSLINLPVILDLKITQSIHGDVELKEMLQMSDWGRNLLVLLGP